MPLEIIIVARATITVVAKTVLVVVVFRSVINTMLIAQVLKHALFAVGLLTGAVRAHKHVWQQVFSVQAVLCFYDFKNCPK